MPKTGQLMGSRAEGLSFDQRRVTARKNKVVRILNAGVKTKLQNANVQVVTAKGAILGNIGPDFKLRPVPNIIREKTCC